MTWDAATFEGAVDAARDAVRRATPQQRMDWLQGALQLARESGALARCREEEELELRAAWEGQLVDGSVVRPA